VGVAALDEFVPKFVVDEEQAVSVFAGIVGHLLWQRSYPPVCNLVLLVGVDVAVVLEQVGQRESREREHLARRDDTGTASTN